MAKITRLVPAVRRVIPEDEFSGHTGPASVLEWEAEDRSDSFLWIRADSPTPSDFNYFNDGTVVPNGTLLTNRAAGGLTYVKTDAEVWTELGELT